VISDQSSSVKSAVALCLLVVLLFATWLYWQCSYTASPLSTFTLQPSSLSFPATFTATAASKTVANITFTIPKFADGAHISFSAKAIDIVPGAQSWLRARARFLPNEPIPGSDFYLFLLDGNRSESGEFIIQPAADRRCVIQIQNIATTGKLVVEKFNIFPIHSRWWRLPAGILLWIVWIAWACALIHTIAHQTPLRSLAASILFVLSLYALTRDWTLPIRHPVFAPFLVGTPAVMNTGKPPIQTPHPPTERKKDDVSTHHPTPSAFAEPSSISLPSVLRAARDQVKPLLHLLFFMALSFALTILVDWKLVVALCAATALASEASQILFGQPSTLTDVGDLALNACGIFLGVLLAKTLARMLARQFATGYTSRKRRLS